MIKKKLKYLSYDSLDPVFLFAILGLIGIGIVMVASSSFAVAQKSFSGPFHYIISQSARLLIGAILSLFVVNMKLSFLENNAKNILLFSIILLILVFIPGIGKTVNGSTRWINLGIFRLQVSEVAKLGSIIYVSQYLVNYKDIVRTSFAGFINPMLIICLIIFLLMCEPDFGASVVIMFMALGLFFLAGVSLWTFGILVIGASGAFAILALSSPYRLARLTAFLDPWANQFNSGYQLTQSLIAFGRGGWLGSGLGEGIQKLFYLPEAHTDFIFAVITEELGLLGGISVILLYAILFFRGMHIGYNAHKLGKSFNGYLAQGITFIIAAQMLINIGVNTGILPTKGLTLPLISYGGSSLVITCVTLALIFRVHIENNQYN